MSALIAGVVAAAGVAFLYGTDAGKKSRQKIKGWTLKAKGEILEKLEDAKDISEDSFNTIVSGVVSKYAKLKKVEQKEVDSLLKEMKKHWGVIKKELKGATASTKKSAKRAVKNVKKVKAVKPAKKSSKK